MGAWSDNGDEAKARGAHPTLQVSGLGSRPKLDLTVRGWPESESPVTGLWYSIQAGPRRRGRAWEKVRDEIWV